MSLQDEMHFGLDQVDMASWLRLRLACGKSEFLADVSSLLFTVVC